MCACHLVINVYLPGHITPCKEGQCTLFFYANMVRGRQEYLWKGVYTKGAYLKDTTVYMCVYILCMCDGGKEWNLWAIIKMTCI